MKRELLGMMLLLTLAACQKPAELNQQVTTEQDENSYIIGGQLVSSSDVLSKSTVQIVERFSGTICTGVIIEKNVVLTAAHCMVDNPEQNLVVFFGNKLVTSLRTLTTKNTRTIAKASVSNIWPTVPEEQILERGDIAVLKLSSNIPIGYLTVSLLPNGTKLQNGLAVTLAGYGITNGVTNQDTTGLRKVGMKLANGSLSPSEIVFDQRDGKGACHGDSGGPAYATINNKLYVIGITSHGAVDALTGSWFSADGEIAEEAAVCTAYSVYTRPEAYKSLIEQVRGVASIQ